MPPQLAYGQISADFLDIALRTFVGFWAIMIIVALTYFGYILVSIKLHRRARRK